MLAGGIAGGGTYTILGWNRPKMDRSLRLGVAGMVGVVAGGLKYSATGEPNPFGGTWVQDIPRSHCGRGAPLRSATLTISEERDGLKIEDDAVSANGQRQHLPCTFVADGIERPDPTATADTVAVTIKDATLNTVFRKARLVTEQETKTLSADRKQMTLTNETALPDGNKDEVIVQFDRKE